MGAKNYIHITENRDGVFELFHSNADNDELGDSIGLADTLEHAVDMANDFEEDLNNQGLYVEYGLKIDRFKSKNAQLLAEFVEFCKAHPELRFWQCLSACFQGTVCLNGQDTFYWPTRGEQLLDNTGLVEKILKVKDKP